MDGPYGQERGAAPLRLQFRLTVDPATRADEDTVAALLNVFPHALRPDVSVTVQLTESTAGGAALIILTITVIGPALKWMGKKVMGPPSTKSGSGYATWLENSGTAARPPWRASRSVLSWRANPATFRLAFQQAFSKDRDSGSRR
jgi:hypothetical protein